MTCALQQDKNRNTVERAFDELTQWRGLATHCDKHAQVYRGAVVRDDPSERAREIFWNTQVERLGVSDLVLCPPG